MNNAINNATGVFWVSKKNIEKRNRLQKEYNKEKKIMQTKLSEISQRIKEIPVKYLNKYNKERLNEMKTIYDLNYQKISNIRSKLRSIDGIKW